MTQLAGTVIWLLSLVKKDLYLPVVLLTEKLCQNSIDVPNSIYIKLTIKVK